MGSTVASIFGSGAKAESESSGESSFKNDPVNSFTPFGSVTYKQDEETGEWTQNVDLTPNQQRMLNQQETFGITSGDWATNSNRLNSALNQYVTPLDTSGLFDLSANGKTPLGQGLAQAFGMSTSAFNPETYDKAYGTLLTNYTQGMEKARDRDIANQQQALANQGIRVGSEAWDRATGDLNSKWYENLSNAQQQAAADAYKYSMEDASLNNAAMTQALQNAISANQANLEQQTLENTYLYKILESLMGNTNVTLPQGYTGAPLSGSGTAEQSSESSSSSGGLLNSIGGFFGF